MYDPQLGTWHAPDPMAAYMPGISPYAYVLNNPIILVDPDGAMVDLGDLLKRLKRTIKASKCPTAGKLSNLVSMANAVKDLVFDEIDSFSADVVTLMEETAKELDDFFNDDSDNDSNDDFGPGDEAVAAAILESQAYHSYINSVEYARGLIQGAMNAAREYKEELKKISAEVNAYNKRQNEIAEFKTSSYGHNGVSDQATWGGGDDVLSYAGWTFGNDQKEVDAITDKSDQNWIIKNNSPKDVFFLTEDGTGVGWIKPGETYNGHVDAIATMKYNDQVFKIPGHYYDDPPSYSKVKIRRNGSVRLKFWYKNINVTPIGSGIIRLFEEGGWLRPSDMTDGDYKYFKIAFDAAKLINER